MRGTCGAVLVVVALLGSHAESRAEDADPAFDAHDDWLTVEDRSLGSDSAVPGGTFRTSIANWPDNLRAYGLRSNAHINQLVTALCFESLLRIDSRTQELVPGLASHWRFSNDGRTLAFRIDPRARWAGGEPVTSRDVVATLRLIADEATLDPFARIRITDRIRETKALSDRVVQVECRARDWRNLLSIATCPVLPADDLFGVGGAEYLERFAERLPTVSGPYELDEDRSQRGKRLVLKRRRDDWGRDVALNRGLHNFDAIEFHVIGDQQDALQKTLAGELDVVPVHTAEWWSDAAAASAVRNGWVFRRKVYTRSAQAIQGLAFNMRRPPLDDLGVRRAIAHLFDRKTLVEKFAFGEYDLLTSYYPGGDGENPHNPRVDFDPALAARLLDEAGWTRADEDDVRTKDGRRLSLDLSYYAASQSRYYEAFRDDARRAGVEIVPTRGDPESIWRQAQQREFDILSFAWGGTEFPDPRALWHSESAPPRGNNLVGFASERADALIERYEDEFDLDQRNALLRELDGVIHAEHPYVLSWYLPCQRIVYANRFGTPAGALPRYSEWEAALTYWWVDPARSEWLDEAREKDVAIEPLPPVEVRPRDEWEDGATR
jgi:microcin C transport system substrate-binding protein